MNKLKILAIGLLLGGVLAIKLYVHRAGEMDRTVPAFDIQRAYDAENLVPIAIIGSGPAGLTASIYGGRAQVKSLVVNGNKPGGQLTETTWVENWPGKSKIKGPDIIRDLRKQAEGFGVDFFTDTITEVDFSTWPFVLKTEDRTLHALSVIITTGSTPYKLGVPGEKEYWGRGITTCAICDAPYYRRKEVVVVGGGDSAVEEALQLSTYADKITILVRRDTMRASAHMQNKLSAYNKINVLYNTEIQKINGDGNQITSVTVLDNKTNQLTDFTTHGIFLAIGHKPNSKIFSKYINTDSNGFIEIQGSGQSTNIPGVFAAGDVADNRYRQAGVAAGNGIRAALDALSFLENCGFTEHVAQELEANYFEDSDVIEEEISSVGSIEELDREIKNSPVPIILEFTSDGCPCCVHMLHIIRRVANFMKDKVKFLTANISSEGAKEIAYKVGAKTVPTLCAFDTKGKVVKMISSSLKKRQLYRFVDEVLEKIKVQSRQEKEHE
ncbi:thioredoxin-disulfide reductase [bacterium]|nr:thioredoxin-disulfide reductase [bacterium]